MFLFRTWDVLSFDGGGTKGVMEAKILQHVMNMVTLICRRPEEATELLFNLNDPDDLTNISLKLNNIEGRAAIMDKLANENKPIHPTEVFDIICGTSTGALIAFGLVGGKVNVDSQDEEVGQTEKRCPMTVKEVIDFYLTKSGHIFPNFKRSYWRSFVLSVPFSPFKLDGLITAINETFGESTPLSALKYKGCFAACVAKQFNENSNNPNDLEIFDCHLAESGELKVAKVLCASANAPIYLQTPTTVQPGKNYIDGGLGANCPLELVKYYQRKEQQSK
jgi:patatin-like phospholipase/acyl hydrolase